MIECRNSKDVFTFKHICRIPVFICCLLIFYLFVPSSLQAECISGDCYNGTGTYTWPDGQRYVGEFRDGKLHGTGTYTWPDGTKYVGEYRDNKRSRGTLTWPDGRRYEGEFWDDKRSRGTLTWPDGRRYEGEWLDDKRNGRGTYTWPDGTKEIGEYRDDNLIQIRATAGGLSQPATTTEPQNSKYIIWIVLGVAFAVFIIFLIWNHYCPVIDFKESDNLLKHKK